MVVGLESWTLARPELFLAASAMLLLLYGVVRGEVATPFVSVATSVALLATAVLLFAPYREGTAFSSLFIVDRLTATMKALVLLVIFFGFYPAPLLDVTAVSVKTLVSGYEASIKAPSAPASPPPLWGRDREGRIAEQ